MVSMNAHGYVADDPAAADGAVRHALWQTAMRFDLTGVSPHQPPPPHAVEAFTEALADQGYVVIEQNPRNR